MAPKSPILLSFLLLFAVVVAEPHGQHKQSTMTVYFQDISGGPNATTVLVTGIAGKHWSFTQFGTIYVVDDPVTEGPERNSTSVGRVQGTYIISSFDGLNAQISLSIVFTNRAYNGSSLQLLGSDKQVGTAEVGVVSGTGKFRYAKGYATSKIISYDRATAYSVSQCNITILQYY